MQLNGQAVRHKTFGNGIITDLADNIVTICFSQGEKKFLYPEAFVYFLTLKDRSIQNKIDNILNKKKKEEQEQKLIVQEEQERIQGLRNLKITPNSQAVFNLKIDNINNVFLSWKVSTGYYLSGYSKGKPRIPDRLKPNSACLLTECPKGMPEKNRRIKGAFMVKEDFFGDLCRDGLIESHERYRVELKKKEILPFWDYFSEKDQLQRWGNTTFKYFNNSSMQQILFDIKNTLCDSEDQEVADEFYQYFCEINRLPDYGSEDS